MEAAASALTAGRRRQIRMLIEDVERLGSAHLWVSNGCEDWAFVYRDGTC